MWQLSPGLVVTVQTVSQYTTCVTNFNPVQKCGISEVQRLKMWNLDVPCRIAVLGSQMWDDSTQCRMADRSARMFQKKKKKRKEKKKKSLKQQKQQQQKKKKKKRK